MNFISINLENKDIQKYCPFMKKKKNLIEI